MNKTTKYIVTYQNAFGFSPREEKIFSDMKEAQWFERAMKRSNYITSLLEVKAVSYTHLTLPTKA